MQPETQSNWLSDKRVAARYSVSRMTIWRWSKDQSLKFPQPRKLSANVTRWNRAELDAYDLRRLEVA